MPEVGLQVVIIAAAFNSFLMAVYFYVLLPFLGVDYATIEPPLMLFTWTLIQWVGTTFVLLNFWSWARGKNKRAARGR